MASGTGRLTFLDTAALRSIYPGTFPTEFMFRSPSNLFSTVQFVPERVLEFSISPDGIRFYKVQWQETWLPEHLLLPYQNLIEMFWRNQSELAAANNIGSGGPGSTETATKPSSAATPTSEVHTNVVVKTQHNGNAVNQSIFTTLQAGDSMETPMEEEPLDDVGTNVKTLDEQHMSNQNVEIVSGLKQHHELQPMIKQQKIDQDNHDFQKQTNQFVKPSDIKGSELSKQFEFMKHPDIAKPQNEESFEIIVQRPNSDPNQLDNDVNQITIEYDNVILNLPNNQILNVPIEDGLNTQSDSQIHMPGDNELTKVMSPRFKKNKQTSIQLEGFELANIENPTATEEELRQQAREVLSSFRRKRVRFPNGSSKLPQTCFFCTKILSNRKKLREHQFSVHFKNVGEFLCGICQQRFIFRRQLKAHMITHSDNRNYVCKLCGLTCKRRSHLHKHMDTHQKERNYRCDVCHKNFKVQAELKEHCLQEHKSQVSKCNVCKQTLHTAYSVYIHSMRHSGTRDHVCQVCGATFKRKQHLIAHNKVHENAPENIKCPACDKEFPEKKYFRRHLEQVHKELAPTYRYDYICDICDKDFAYKGRLDEHMKLHAEETEEQRSARAKKKKVDSMSEDALEKLCDKIEKVTDPKTGEVKLKCKLCRRREFRLISTMEKHLEDHKTGSSKLVKPAGNFECEICHKTFHSEARLIRHGIVHQSSALKQNQYQCRRCKKTFKWKSCLQAHTKKCSPISKGAGKRKATLKAKEKLRLDVTGDTTGGSSDEEDEEGIQIVHVDDIVPSSPAEYEDDSEELKLAGHHDEDIELPLHESEDLHVANDVDDDDSAVTVQGVSSRLDSSTNSENVIVMRNMDTKQNVISVTHSDSNRTANSGDLSTDAPVDNIYVITVRPADEESGEVMSSQDECVVHDCGEISDGYEFPPGLHNVESNVSVETVVHQGVYQESVEIETDHTQ